MKHQTLDDLRSVAEVKGDGALVLMTRGQRLDRWATILERDPDRMLGALPGTEYMSPEARQAASCLNSPISIAFQDEFMRANGMKDDSYGEAKRFFELSDAQLHDIVCYCHVGETMRSQWAAQRVRAAMSQT